MVILWPSGIRYDLLYFVVTDAARYMKKEMSNLQVLYIKITHVTCLAAHALHLKADHIQSKFLLVDQLISNMKKIFRKAPSRVDKFKELYPEIPLPPSSALTHWGTWSDACKYIC